MNVLLIQPPESPPPVRPVVPPGFEVEQLAPPWSLLCLRSYLLEHTRHVCHFLDCRLFTDLERDLRVAIGDLPPCSAAVVNTTSMGLGQASAVLDILKRAFPALRTVLCGQHPSQFPNQVVEMPRVDYALAGDPEPILRNLLDYLDVDARLWRTPGLIIGASRTTEPYWLPDLKGLSLPDWQGVFWNAYGDGPEGKTCRMPARISRGHTRLPADRAAGHSHEPLRIWPLDRMADVLQKAGCRGITEIPLADPPGIWTAERLEQWCSALLRTRNVQPWSLRIHPTVLAAPLLDDMAVALCRRIEIVLPSCQPDILARYGCTLSTGDLRHAARQIEHSGLRVHFRFWVGGPEEAEGEAERITRTIRRLGFPSWSLQAFPFIPDTPLYEEQAASSATHMEDWVAWSRDPWLLDRPVALWGGADAIPVLQDELRRIERRIERSPGRNLRRFLQRARSTNWIAAMEDKALSLIAPQGPPPNP